MRHVLAFAFALLAAAPATAGVRATYATPGEANPLVVEVADNGDARVGEAGGDDYGLLVGGQFYMVGGKPGEWTVARIADIARAIDGTLGPTLGGAIFGDVLAAAGPPAPKATIRSTAQGSRTVGGQRGTVYAVAGLDHEKPDATIEVVASDDPALRPVGRALEGFMNAAMIPAAPLLGAGAGELIAETRVIFALGTPLSSAGRFTLQKVEQGTIPPARVALPDAPVTYETLLTKMRALVPGKAK
ncbi:hypothetical protein [Sphingomonas solaris]|uniref:Uncharacterized protein n=1 Tax=Alterirhizorhabdus solaris TaxID=2529389 RepID=A0A558R1B8_9SPHN|nr:hypothetical protein [Sphingomonas solaris]TVV73186.1 hypothetical protein FOY91_12920 [Sphingomonas solaris]